MEIRYSVFLIGLVLWVGMQTASAEDNKIQSFVNPNGRVVFTNLVNDNAPVRPAAPETPAPAAAKAKQSSAVPVPTSLQTLVDTIAGNHGVDPALVRAVIKTESNFNRYAVSNKGAMGLMQLIPSTGRRYGVRDFFDPQQNIDGGVRYLKFLLQKFQGNVELSVAAYNAGENLVERLGRIPSIPETVNYVRKIRGMYKSKYAPLMTPAPAAPVLNTVATVAAAETAAAAPAPEPPKIFKMVDARGVVHFSNIEPPN